MSSSSGQSGGSSAAKIGERGFRNMRSTEEIQTYLENFVPNISPSFTIQAMIIKPISMLINISFIGYSLYKLHHDDSRRNYSDNTLWFSKHIVVYLEFFGLVFLIITTGFAYFYFKHISMTVDLISLCGSWSSFKLFYQFRPQQLFLYCSTYFTQNTKRLQISNVEKTKKLQRIKGELDHEIKYLKNIKTRKVNTLFSMEAMSKKMQKIIGFNQSERKRLEKEKESKSSSIWNVTKARIDTDAQIDRMVTVGSWLIIIILCISFMCIGIMSLLMKIAQLTFIKTEITDWNLSDYYILFAFCNQLWGMVNIDSITIDTIYQFMFMDSSCKLTRYISKRILILDDIIKSTLCKYYGIQGFLLSVAFNAKFLKKIVIKDPYSLSIENMIKYKYKLDHIYAKNINDDNKSDDIGLVSTKINKPITSFSINTTNDLKESLLSKDNDEFDEFNEEKKENNDKASKSIISINKLREWRNSGQEYAQKYLDRLCMISKQAPIHPYFKCKNCVSRHEQKLQFTQSDLNIYLIQKQKNVLFYEQNLIWNDYIIKNWSKKEVREYKIDKTDDDIIETKYNYLKNNVSLFEKIEWFINKSTFFVWIIILCLCCLFSSLALIIEDNDFLINHDSVDTLYDTLIINAVCSGTLLLFMLFFKSGCFDCIAEFLIFLLVIILCGAVGLGLVYQIFIFVFFTAPDANMDLLENIYKHHGVLFIALSINEFCICLIMSYVLVWMIANWIMVIMGIYGLIIAFAAVIRYYYAWFALILGLISFFTFQYAQDVDVDECAYNKQNGITQFMLIFCVIKIIIYGLYLIVFWAPFYVYKQCVEDEKLPKKWINAVCGMQGVCIFISLIQVITHWISVEGGLHINDCLGTEDIMVLFCHWDVISPIVFLIDSKFITKVSISEWWRFFLKIGIKNDWKHYAYPLFMIYWLSRSYQY